MNKIDELITVVQTFKPHLVAITEKWLHDQINDAEIAINDEIHPKILTSLAGYLPAPLAKLFNNSLETGITAVEWKSSIICPIYKKGSKPNVAKYRPPCYHSPP